MSIFKDKKGVGFQVQCNYATSNSG